MVERACADDGLSSKISGLSGLLSISSILSLVLLVFPRPSKGSVWESTQTHVGAGTRALLGPRASASRRRAAPPGAAPMPFPAFRCLHPKRAVALLGHQASGETALQKYRHAGTLKQAGLGVWGMRQHGESTRSCERAPPNKHTPQTPTFPLQRPMARDTRSRSPR